MTITPERPAKNGRPADDAKTQLRVVMLGSLPPQRGISTYCLELAAELSQWIELTFLNFRNMYPAWAYPGREEPRDASFPQTPRHRMDVRAHLDWYNPLTWIWAGLATPGNLLHVQFWSLPLLPVTLVVMMMFRLRGKPIVLTVHNTEAHERSACFRLGLVLLLWLSQVVIVHTSAQLEQLARWFPWCRDRLRQTPHGVLRTYQRNSPTPSGAREQLGIDTADRVILFFGAIRPYKGVDTLLEAFASIVRSEPNARLLIVGKLWESWDRYQAIVDRYDFGDRVTTRLEYVPTNEVNTYFAAADVVALPYRRFAAQSGVALAAIGCHKPIVATTVGGLEELLAHPRCLVEPDQPQQLAEQLVAVLADPTLLAELLRHSRDLAEEFEWASIVDRLIGHYRELLFAQEPVDSPEDSDHRFPPSLHAVCENSEGGLPGW